MVKDNELVIPVIRRHTSNMNVREGYIIVELLKKNTTDETTGMVLTGQKGNQDVGLVFRSYPGAFAQKGDVLLLPASSTQRFTDDSGREFIYVCEEDCIVKWPQEMVDPMIDKLIEAHRKNFPVNE